MPVQCKDDRVRKQSLRRSLMRLHACQVCILLKESFAEAIKAWACVKSCAQDIKLRLEAEEGGRKAEVAPRPAVDGAKEAAGVGAADIAMEVKGGVESGKKVFDSTGIGYDGCMPGGKKVLG